MKPSSALVTAPKGSIFLPTIKKYGWGTRRKVRFLSSISPRKKVVETIPANARGANRLKFTPDGTRVFVSTLFGGELIVLDAHTHKELKRLKLGKGAAGILMQPDGARAFVACSPDNNIAVIDLKTLEVVSRFDVGQEPDGMAWSVSH